MLYTYPILILVVKLNQSNILALSAQGDIYGYMEEAYTEVHWPVIPDLPTMELTHS